MFSEEKKSTIFFPQKAQAQYKKKSVVLHETPPELKTEAHERRKKVSIFLTWRARCEDKLFKKLLVKKKTA